MAPKLADIKSESWLDLTKEQPIKRPKWLLRRAQTQVPETSSSSGSSSHWSGDELDKFDTTTFRTTTTTTSKQAAIAKTKLSQETSQISTRRSEAEVAKLRNKTGAGAAAAAATASSISGSTCSLTQDHLLIRIRQESFRLSRRRSSLSDVKQRNSRDDDDDDDDHETSLEHSVKISDLIELRQFNHESYRDSQSDSNNQQVEQQQQIASSRLQKFKSRLERRGRRGSSLLRESDLQKLQVEKSIEHDHHQSVTDTDKDKSLFGHQRSFSSLGDKFSHLRRSWSKFLLSSTHSLHNSSNCNNKEQRNKIFNGDKIRGGEAITKEEEKENEKKMSRRSENDSRRLSLRGLDDATDPINRMLLTERWLANHHQLDRPTSLQLDKIVGSQRLHIATDKGIGIGDIKSIGRDSSSSTTLVDPTNTSIIQPTLSLQENDNNENKVDANQNHQHQLIVTQDRSIAARASSLEPNCLRLRNNIQHNQQQQRNFASDNLTTKQLHYNNNLLHKTKQILFNNRNTKVIVNRNEQHSLGINQFQHSDNFDQLQTGSQRRFASLKTDTASSISSSRTTTTTGSSSYSFNITMQQQHYKHHRHHRHHHDKCQQSIRTKTNNSDSLATTILPPASMQNSFTTNHQPVLTEQFAPDEYYFEAANESTTDEEAEDEESTFPNSATRRGLGICPLNAASGQMLPNSGNSYLGLVAQQQRGHSVDAQLSTGGSSSLERMPNNFSNNDNNNGYNNNENPMLAMAINHQQHAHFGSMAPNVFQQTGIVATNYPLLIPSAHSNGPLMDGSINGLPTTLTGGGAGAVPMMDPDYDDYAIPSDENFCRLDRTQVELVQMIGEGQKGFVFLGKLQSRDGRQMIDVAIKTLKYETDQMIDKLMHEAAMMRQFEHPHIIRFIGVCPETPALIAMELARFGELRQYLRSNQHLISVSQLVLFSFQISTALSYLESKQFVHRDVAARNVLVCSPTCVKLADFGLSRNLQIEPPGCQFVATPAANNHRRDNLQDTHNNTNKQLSVGSNSIPTTQQQQQLLLEPEDKTGHYVAIKPGKLPVRWLAPESLTFRRFTSASDVWMFAVCTWEIFYLGQLRPWPHIANNQVLAAIGAGQRLARPPACPARLYQLLLQCWSYAPVQRPKFRDIKQDLWSIYLSERTREQILMEEVVEREKQETHLVALAAAAAASRQQQQQNLNQLQQQQQKQHQHQQEHFDMQRENCIRQILKQQERNRLQQTRLHNDTAAAAAAPVAAPTGLLPSYNNLGNFPAVDSPPSPTRMQLNHQHQHSDSTTSGVGFDRRSTGNQSPIMRAHQHHHASSASSSAKSSSAVNSLARRRRTMLESKQAISCFEPSTNDKRFDDDDDSDDNSRQQQQKFKTRSLRRHQLQKQRSQGSIMSGAGGGGGRNHHHQRKPNPAISIAQAIIDRNVDEQQQHHDQVLSFEPRSRAAILQSWHSERLLCNNNSRSSGNSSPDLQKQRRQSQNNSKAQELTRNKQATSNRLTEATANATEQQQRLQAPAYEGVSLGRSEVSIASGDAGRDGASVKKISHQFEALHLSSSRDDNKTSSASNHQEANSKEKNRELEQRNRLDLHRRLLGHIRPASSASSSRARDRANRNSLNITSMAPLSTSTASATSNSDLGDTTTTTNNCNHNHNIQHNNKLQHRPLPSIPGGCGAGAITRVESVDQSLEILASLISTTKTTNDHAADMKLSRADDRSSHREAAKNIPKTVAPTANKSRESEFQQEWRRRMGLRSGR